jgi:ArsR family metal-binding transcriptional regulator
MSYLESIFLTQMLPCLAEPGKIIIIGKPSRPLDEVLPYLATLPGILAWNPDIRTLTFRRPRGFMTLYPDKVHITQI